jgi:hypothetical protein
MTFANALKLHLRLIEVHGRILRVVTLRPQTEVRFSTNYYHDTWHILAGDDGARLFGALLWGLAYQRQPGTVLLIDGDHLVSTPFDADPPDPILVVPDGLTSLDVDALRAFKLRWRRAPVAPTTIRWHTFGLAAAHEREPRSYWRLRRDPTERARARREQMTRRAGFVCFTAPPELLRRHALGISRMAGDGYHPIADHGDHLWGYDGEFQVIPEFAAKVSAARVARREVAPEVAGRLPDDFDQRWAVYDQADDALRRLKQARRRARTR